MITFHTLNFISCSLTILLERLLFNRLCCLDKTLIFNPWDCMCTYCFSSDVGSGWGKDQVDAVIEWGAFLLIKLSISLLAYPIVVIDTAIFLDISDRSYHSCRRHDNEMQGLLLTFRIALFKGWVACSLSCERNNPSLRSEPVIVITLRMLADGKLSRACSAGQTRFGPVALSVSLTYFGEPL